jgi:hypothetical protein
MARLQPNPFCFVILLGMITAPSLNVDRDAYAFLVMAHSIMEYTLSQLYANARDFSHRSGQFAREHDKKRGNLEKWHHHERIQKLSTRRYVRESAYKH